MTRNLLGGLLTLGALNAFAGGYYGLSGAEDVPLEWLAGGPFRDYFVPSLILFVVVGGAFTIAAAMVFTRYHLARAGAFAAAAIVLGWIIVQLAIIGYVSWMQPVTFATGLLILLMTWLQPSSRAPTRTNSETGIVATDSTMKDTYEKSVI